MGSSWIRPLSSALLSAGQAFRVAKFSVMICILGIFVHLCRGQATCTSENPPANYSAKFNKPGIISVYGKLLKDPTGEGKFELENHCVMKGEKLNKTLKLKKGDAGDGWCFPTVLTSLEEGSEYLFFLKKMDGKNAFVDFHKITNKENELTAKCGKKEDNPQLELNDCKKPGSTACTESVLPDPPVITDQGKGTPTSTVKANNVSKESAGGAEQSSAKPGNAGVSHTISLTFMWIAAAMSTGSIYIFM